MRAVLGIVLAAVATVPQAAVAAAPVQSGPADASASAVAIAASGVHRGLSRPSLGDVAPGLAILYPRDAPALLWFEGARPTPALSDAVAVLARAEAVGLDPRRFDAHLLGAEAARAEAGVLPPAERALLDVAVTVEWMRFLRAAHAGLVPRGRAGRDLALPARPLDLVRLVRETAAGAGSAAVLASVEPRHPGYARLRGALPGLRSLPATPPIPPLPPGARKLEAGATWDGVPAVRARLLAEGDLPSTSPPPPDARVLDAALAEAIRRFQARHALREDGILGKRTLAELSVPPARRVRQAELAMERWRWLPDPARRVVVVEVPRAWLWAADLAHPGTELGMRTVVGAPHGHDTPMFASRITTVVFRPSWVPPPRILREEILPRARARPAWLGEHGMEIVASPAEDAEPLPPTEEALVQVEKGELLLRQKPGPKSDLGLVKFVVPDSRCIALHGTPHGNLFQEPERERSHGCIRLERPDALARWVLSGEPGWTPERIAEAQARDRATTVPLREPIPVVTVYGTAAVDPDGTIHFVDDAYHLDAAAEAVLRHGPAGR